MDPNIRNRGVQVSRENIGGWPEEDPSIDSNNNRERVINNPADPETYRRNTHMDAVAVGFSALPPISTSIAVLQLVLYHIRESINVKTEEDVYVSWKIVVTEKQYWRLFCAHFFHFGRVHLFINFITLISIGRYLEKKLNKPATLILIQLMGVMSNMLYILLNSYLCMGPHNEYTYGFSNVLYSLRVILAYTQEPRNYEVALAFGLWPFELSANWAPWQPLFEVLVLKLVIPEVCMTGSISGICTGFFFSFIILAIPSSWHSLIEQDVVPQLDQQPPPALQPPPPPRNNFPRNGQQRVQTDNEDNQRIRPPVTETLRTTQTQRRSLPGTANHRAARNDTDFTLQQRRKWIPPSNHTYEGKDGLLSHVKYLRNVRQRHTIR